MPLLLAIVGQRDDLTIKEVVLADDVQDAVQGVFLEQERAFRSGSEVPFDANWKIDVQEIAVTSAERFPVFDQIAQTTDTTVEPLGADELEQVRGLVMDVADGAILVQSFTSSMLLNRRGLVSLLFDAGTYTHLEAGAFRLADKLVCLVEDEQLKFRSLNAMGRIVDTSTIFRKATDSEVERFANDNAALFHFGNIGDFLDVTTRNARKYISSIGHAGTLAGHTVQSLQHGRQANAPFPIIHSARGHRAMLLAGHWPAVQRQEYEAGEPLKRFVQLSNVHRTSWWHTPARPSSWPPLLPSACSATRGRKSGA